MPVKSTYIKKNDNQNGASVPYDYHFNQISEFQITKTIHGKNIIQSIQCYDENEEFIEPSVKIEHSTGTIYVQSSVPITGKVRIF